MNNHIRQHTPSQRDRYNQMGLVDILVTAGSLGFTLFVSILVGVGMGHYIDTYCGTSPWGLIICALLGAVAGFWSLYKRVMALNQTEHTGKGNSPWQK